MNNYNETLKKLTSAFCLLKGIDTPQSGKINDININFEEWDWEIGVGLYGFWRYADATKSLELKQSLMRWYDDKIQEGLPRKHVNSAAPMLTLALLCKEYPKPAWREIIADWAEYFLTQAPKTKEFGLQHTVKERDNDGQLWDDTLFMAALFLWAAGDLLQRDDLKEEALYQFLIHIRFLNDQATGLYYHGWTFEGSHHYAKALWGRGNAWIAMVIPELLRLDEAGDIPFFTKKYLTAVWQTLIEKITKLQHEDGYWNTLLDDPSSPKELSATAGFAYALVLGQQLNILEQSKHTKHCVDQAVQSVMMHINEDGMLEAASDGTAMGHDLQFYRDIGNAYTPYAQAIAMLLLCALETKEN